MVRVQLLETGDQGIPFPVALAFIGWQGAWTPFAISALVDTGAAYSIVKLEVLLTIPGLTREHALAAPAERVGLCGANFDCHPFKAMLAFVDGEHLVPTNSQLVLHETALHVTEGEVPDDLLIGQRHTLDQMNFEQLCAVKDPGGLLHR